MASIYSLYFKMTIERPKVVIIGGGPCGLYAARTLVDHSVDVTVLDLGEKPGGLATSAEREGNFYDFGVHMLHEYDKPLLEDILKIMGDEEIPVQLDAKIRWAGSFYRYPLQFGDMIKGIPPVTLAKCVFGLLSSQLYFKIFPKKPKDAEQALIQLYGKPLYHFFFKEFTERYWGFPTTEMSASFITTKMPRLTAVDVLKKILAKVGIQSKNVHAVESALADETLHYSRTGAETMTRRIAAYVKEKGGTVLQQREAVRLDMENGRVVAVISRDSSGAEQRHACSACISTMPLPHLVQRLSPAVPAEVIASSEHLRYKPITVHGLLVKKERCIEGLYIYYRECIFHRVGEPKNAGLRVTPEGHTVLIVETTCEPGDDKWQATQAVRDQIVQGLEAENICKKEDIVQWHVFNQRHGYPVFRLGFEQHLERVEATLKTIPNLQSVGRQGGFTYPNMHSAMRMGAKAAENALKQAGIT
jgi:protoporphyrinogen oxidase